MTLKRRGSRIHRRTFVKGLTVGLASLSFTGRGGLAQNPQSFGVALVGLGNYATNQLAPALQETRLCHLAGIVTGSPEKVPIWREKYGIPESNVYSYENFDEIAQNRQIDIIYIVLPNSMHAEYTIKAARAGRHVICEKPMAVSVEQCRRMIEACKQAGVKLSIGYRLHFEPHNREAMRIGQEEAFGPIKLVESSFGFPIGDPTQWRLDKELAGGGALMDVGIYAIQAARYTIGKEPLSVTAREYKTDAVKFAEVDETIVWQMEFPGDVAASSATSYSSYVERLYGTAPRGWFELSPAYSYQGIKGRTMNGPMNFPQINQQVLQMDNFARCILEDRESRVSGEEGLRDMLVIEAIYESIRRGEPVRIN